MPFRLVRISNPRKVRAIPTINGTVISSEKRITAAIAAIATWEAFNRLTATTGKAFSEIVNATKAAKLKKPAANITNH